MFARGAKNHIHDGAGARSYTQMNKNSRSPGRRRNYATAVLEEMKEYRLKHPGSPAAVRRPEVFLRGDLWIALLGPSLEDGIVGIGPTVAAALRAFDTQYIAKLRPPNETIKSPATSGLAVRAAASALAMLIASLMPC